MYVCMYAQAREGARTSGLAAAPSALADGAAAALAGASVGSCKGGADAAATATAVGHSECSHGSGCSAQVGRGR